MIIAWMSAILVTSIERPLRNSLMRWHAEKGYGEKDGDDSLVDDYDQVGLALGIPVAEIINHYYAKCMLSVSFAKNKETPHIQGRESKS